MNNGKIRILLVEDDEGHAGLIRRAFEAHGRQMSLTVVDTIQEARGLLAQSLPDLLIADLLLPDGLGVELLSGDADGREFPTIVMASFGNEQAAVDALKTGAIDYVVKSKATLADMPRIAERALREWESIVARKEAEVALRKSEEKYRLHFENASDVVYSVDREFRFLSVSPSVERVIGYKPEELIGKLFTELNLLAPEYLEKAISDSIRVFAGEQISSVVYEFLTKDGSRRFGEINSVPVFRDGKVVATASLARDITQRKRVEEALRKSEEEYRLLIENQTDMVVKFDVDGRLLFVSPSYCRTFGKSEEELLGKKFMPLVHEEDREAVARAIEAVYKPSRTSHIHQERALTKDGWRWQEWTNSAVLNEQGEIVEIIGDGRDITERKRAEEEREREKTRAQEYLNIAGVMLAVVDADEATTLINRKGCEILNYSEAELIGKNWFDTLVPQGLRESVRGVFRRLMAGDIEPVEYYENQLLTKDGEEILVSFHNTIIRDPNGQVVGVLTSGEDITERKRVEEALRDSEFRLAMAIECAGLGLWDQDCRTGNVTRGDNWMRMLGYEPGEIELNVSAWKKLIHPDDKPRVEKCMRDHDAGLTPVFSVEHRLRTKSGHWKWIRNWGRIIERDENGKPIRAIGVHLDVNESKRAAEELARAKDAAEAANRAKSEFLANMSHEIRTPMTAIMGFTDLMMTCEMPPAERREHLQTIHRNAESLLTIINDILDLSKIEAEKIELEHSDCTPQAIVDEVISLMKVRANEKNLSLDAQYVYPLPKTIRTDAVRLRQILVNLVGNALKFTEQGRVRVTVCYVTEEGSRPQIVFEVMDTGIGMEPEDVDRLFRPFVQVDASPTRRFGGTGLGLSISGRLAKMLGGRIDVHSRPGKGSTFTVSIDPGPTENVPLLDGPPNATAEEQLPADLPPGTASLAAGGTALRGRVLLVEDSPDIQNMVLLVLQHWGLEVDVAENGRTGCEKALQSKADGSPYDLILMDIQLPEMDGYQATQYLRQHDWSGPVVALTAHAMAGDRQRCLAAGCDDYVPKPITAEELLKTLAGYLGDGSAMDTQSADAEAADGSPDRPLGSGILDDAEMADLVDAFVGELPDRAEAIQEALKTQDLPALTLRTHQLKGTAAIYGLARISRAAAAANQRATQPDDFEQLEAAVTELIGLCRAAVSQSYGRSG